MRSVFAVVAAAIGIACASPGKAKVSQASVVQATDSKPLNGPVASNDQTKETSNVVCDFEERVGTHMREKVCRYQEDIEAERVETQRMIQHQKVQEAAGK